MKRYNLINNSLGWVIFAIATVTYMLTLEPTASFWDCGEFISQGYKLEVGHPPGNPIFMLTANFFTHFASSPSQVALCVNAMSGLLSAGCILLLFWTVTHLVRRLITKDGQEEYSWMQIALIMGSGVCGALAYAWSDTFWFSAVEGEVYAFSSFCTALTFWLILKWENRSEEPHSDRYLVAIAYVIGVSVAVHLLNLLCIPAIILVIYYKKFKETTAKGSLIALLISFGIIVFILFGLVPGFVEIAQYSELLFVNKLGMPFNTGVIAYALIFVGLLVWTVYSFHKQSSTNQMRWSFLLTTFFSGILFIGSSMLIPIVLTAALAFYLFGVCKKIPVRILYNTALYIAVIFVGYSSYALILIRSNAQTPMDQNSPDNVFALGSYLNREQYGKTPLLYGPTYASPVERDDTGAAVMTKASKYVKEVKASPDEPDRYKEIDDNYNTEYSYPSSTKMLFPRLYDSSAKDKYLRCMGSIDTHPVETGSSVVDVPTFSENIRYFFQYQLNYMYWRYFLWNFAGRQNDLQGQGEINHGNWISGIPFIDNARLGDQDMLPDDLKNNPGRNVFYMLPLLLGLIGLLWQAYCGKRGIEQFWVVFFLFFMTGIAIVLYLNQTPEQPRERDYAYAGSFYAFAIWIGMGVTGLYKLLSYAVRKVSCKKEGKNGIEVTDAEKKVRPALVVAAVAFGIFVPLQMVSQTWDDHDRSGRLLCRDYGHDLLVSCDRDAILFNSGDNLSFPLWYTQDVEDFRTDVRTLNTDYLNSHWYIAQSCYPYFDSKRIPLTGNVDFYAYNYHRGNTLLADTTAVDAIDQLKAFYDKNSTTYGKISPLLTIDVDTTALLRQGKFHHDCAPLASRKIIMDLRVNPFKPAPNTAVNATRMVMVDMAATNAANGWQRNIAFVKCMSANNYAFISPYLAQTGLTIELTPFRQDSYTSIGTGYSDRAYDNMMHHFLWGGLDKASPDNKPYLDEVNRDMLAYMRLAMLDLTDRLIKEGDVAKEAAANPSAFPLLPQRVRSEAFAADRYAKARDILMLKESKLPEFVALSNYEFYRRTADAYYHLWRATGNAADRRKADATISAAIDRFSQHMVYFQTLTFWQPMSPGNRLIYNDGGFLSLLASYANGNPDAARRKIADVERRGVDIWAALERNLNIVRGKEPPSVGKSRVWDYTYEAARTLSAYNPHKYASVLKKNESFAIAVEKANDFHNRNQRLAREQLLRAEH